MIHTRLPSPHRTRPCTLSTLSPYASQHTGPVASAHDDAARCLFRGLRVRGAVDVARVKAELLPATGRLAYRGALAGNVGRMAAFVSVGQVRRRGAGGGGTGAG